MRKVLRNSILFVTIILFSGCTAVGVIYTTNPERMLAQAERLFDRENRPLPAQDLIEKAINIYKNDNNEVGLAKAYLTYAYFLQSRAVHLWSKIDFFDKTVTHKNKLEKALEYWKKSLNLFEKNLKYANASNTYYNIGKLYYLKFNDKEKACDNYTRSIENHYKYKKLHPKGKVVLDSKFSSFEDYINALKDELSCNE